MSEIASEAVEVDSGYYDRNRATILASLEREGFKDQEADEIFTLMKRRLTQDEAIAQYTELKHGDFVGDKSGDRKDNEMSDRYADDLMEEDIDLGHEDDEPHMIKADLYRIGKYAMELYAMADKLEKSGQEIDFPAWWQAMITDAKEQMVKAKHYLDFELNEPAINASVDTMSLYEKYTKA